MSEQLPPGTVVITPNQMYMEMQQIGKKVDHIASVIDPAINQLREDIADVKTDIAAHVADRKLAVTALDSRIDMIDKALELRVRSLENWRWFMIGMSTLVSPMIAFLLALWKLKNG